VLVIACPALVACSGDDDTSSTTIASTVSTGDLEIDLTLLAPAIVALEHELGGPQRYFEINVQVGGIVNLFVAGDDAVTPWAYIAGELSSIGPQPAQGATFPADAIELDPATVMDQVRAELPGAVEQAFELVGGPGDTVRYTALMVSSGGSPILVEVAADGTIVGVDA
jgi:hypothetical protein